ncbi:hypothetical protein [Furfurilactobacillus curtus]|uniref:Uncharacterized protein n=1 Tax=Furfurilactobacillus curtus TaxID=1746200 RepID=A0ABQ5JLF3_9LACO
MTSRKVLTPIEHERCRKAYFNFLADGLQDHDNDIWRTILWASHKFMRMSAGHTSDEQYYLVSAIDELSTAEKNQVIHELTMADEVNQ